MKSAQVLVMHADGHMKPFAEAKTVAKTAAKTSAKHKTKHKVKSVKQSGGGKKNTSIRSVASIVLRLARINGFNEEHQIKGPDGRFMQNTDVLDLINYALKPGRTVNGLEAFISLLRSAKVPVSLIRNAQVLSLLNKDEQYDFYDSDDERPNVTGRSRQRQARTSP